MLPVIQVMAFFIVSTLFCLPGAHGGTESDDPISTPSVVFTQAKRNSVAALNIPADQGDSARAAALSEKDKRFRTQAIIWGGAGTILAYGATVWWKDGSSGHFRTTNEGWFGQDTYTGGADKLGHAYSTYVGTRLLASAFEWAGNDRDDAVILSAATVFGTLLAVETLDGFSERYKFSKEDLIMNAVGTGLGLLFEKNKRLDDLFDFRLHYWPSGDAKRLNQVGPVGDYSGQTYLLVAKATGIPQLKNHDVLRYFELAAGYGSRGFEPNDGVPAPDRSRHVYFGISLNISEILRNTVFRDTSEKSRSQRVTDTVLEYVQVPGTAVLADHRL
ncbi:MAG: YfiM family protein [Gammaproteobacteria bacterium]|nr:YfiM family protein [Gammaproteobacteria bacterium]MBU1978476.1 YfiM family protein [Gammaproteobacteria bacterium]